MKYCLKEVNLQVIHAKDKLYVLFLDDSEKDLEIVRQKLIDDLDCQVLLEWASTEAEFLHYINSKQYDVILADYTLPGYNAVEALRSAISVCPDTPFICISGTIGEDTAVELLKQGAADYVLKDGLGRLSFSILRAIEGAKEKGALREAERKQQIYKRMLEEAQRIAHIGSWEWNITDDKVYWSDETYRLLGLEPQSVPARRGLYFEHMAPEDRDRVGNALNKAVLTKERFDTEFTINGADGKSRIIHSQASLRYEADGSSWLMTGTMQDITERKRVEEDARDNEKAMRENAVLKREAELLREKEQEYLEILDSSTEGSWIYDFQNGSLEFSRELLKRFGCENVPKDDFYLYISQFVHPDDAEKIFRHTKLINDEKKTKYKEEYRIKTANGEYMWVLDQAKFTYDKYGAPVKAYGTTMDITERKRTEEALRQSESLLRAIIEGTTDPIFLRDRQNRIILTNSAAAKVYGLPVEDMIGKSVSDLIKDKEAAERNDQTNRRIMDTDTSEVIEEIVPTKDGYHTYLSTKVPWHDNEGKVKGIIVMCKDITNRKRMEEELKRTGAELAQKNKLITEFFTNISHDFKTPLSIILVQHELMKLYMNDEVKMRDIIAAATQNSYRLLRLVGNLLDITKIDAGYLKANYSHADIVSLLSDICNSVDYYAKARSIQLIFRAGPKKKVMPIDTDIIERILLNLLSNAIKHTQKNGTITVRVKERKNGGVIISVKDTGEGIPNDKLKIIFDRFAQVNTSMTRQNDGCGIGLSLVSSLVKILGGSIAVKSKVGVGSEFIIELPIIETETQIKLIELGGYSLSKKAEMELSDLNL